MSSLLFLPSEEALVELLNNASSIPITRSDLSTIFLPEILEDDPDGANTQVTIRTTLDFSHAGRMTVRYNRIELNQLLSPAVSANIEELDNFTTFLTALSNRYGVDLSLKDLAPVADFDVSTGELSYEIELSALPDSLKYIGTGTVTAKVNWRLDDPEYVEQEVDRLSQLINFDLPEMIYNFQSS